MRVCESLSVSYFIVYVDLMLSFHQVCMYMCPSLNVALCVSFLNNALHIQKRQPVGI